MNSKASLVSSLKPLLTSRIMLEDWQKKLPFANYLGSFYVSGYLITTLGAYQIHNCALIFIITMKHFALQYVQCSSFFYRALNLSASDNKMHTVPGGIIDATKVVLSKTWLS